MPITSFLTLINGIQRSEAVPNSALASMNANTIKGNNTGGSSTPIDLSISQVNTMLGTILANGSVAFTANQSLGGFKITNAADPTSAQDLATKAYIDNALAIFQPEEAVYAASTANIAGTYNNGVSGVGAFITVTATGAFSADGVIPPQGSRVLLKDQTSGLENGVYDVTIAGSLGVHPVLTRSLNYNQPAEIDAGDLIPVINGTANSITSWLQTATVNSVGVDSLVFTQYSKNPSSYLSTALANTHIFVGNASGVAVDVALSGDASISNTGVLTISNNVISNAKFRQSSGLSVVGNSSSSTANVADITGTANQVLVVNSGGSSLGFGAVNLASGSAVTGTLGNSNTTATSSPNASTILSRDSNVNAQINAIVQNLTSTVTAAGTLTITASGSPIQVFTGSTTHILKLPDATTLSNGMTYRVINQSSGAITVQNNGGSTIVTVSASTSVFILLTSNGTTNGTWDTTNDFDSSITALAGDVVASGPGSASATIQANVVSNSKLAQMAATTLKGNNTAGTANAADLTVAQALTMLGIMSGKTAISSAGTSVAVTFSTAFANTSYSITCTMINTTDTNPEFQPLTITVQATTGFTAKWNYPVATANYSLMWQAIVNN